jgi:hypothetical protein
MGVLTVPGCLATEPSAVLEFGFDMVFFFVHDRSKDEGEALNAQLTKDEDLLNRLLSMWRSGERGITRTVHFHFAEVASRCTYPPLVSEPLNSQWPHRFSPETEIELCP